MYIAQQWLNQSFVHCCALARCGREKNFLPSLKIFPSNLIIFYAENLLPNEKKTPKWLINWLIIWLFWYCSFRSLWLYWELSALCIKDSPHENPCGEVEILGLPMKCWKLRWIHIDCSKTWWDDQPTTDECILTVWLTYNTASTLNFCVALCWKLFWTQVFPPSHALCITLYLLTHRAENFCTKLAPKNLSSKVSD